METPLIEFANVTKRFDTRTILDQVNLKIFEGHVTTIIGKSGTGKSVLLKHIIGLLKPDGGNILCRGNDIGKMGKTEWDDYTGKIETINTPLLQSLLDQSLTPVIAPMAVSHNGEALNVDADRAAAMIAAALKADALLLLTAVRGLMRMSGQANGIDPVLQYQDRIEIVNHRQMERTFPGEAVERGGGTMSNAIDITNRSPAGRFFE